MITFEAKKYCQKLKYSIFLLVLLSPLLSSCSSTQKFPLARFSHAEAVGAARAKIETGATNAVKLQPSPDLRDATISQSPQIKSSFAPFVKPTLGLTNSIDIDMYAGLKQGFQLALKFQLLGAPMSSAGAGNFSVGFRIGYSIYVGADEINAGDTYGEPKLDRKMVIDSGYGMYEFLVGYRILQPLLLTVGYFKDEGQYNLKFTEGQRTTIAHEISAHGPLATLLFQPGNLLFQVSFAKGTFEIPNRNRKETDINWGLSAGLLF